MTSRTSANDIVRVVKYHMINPNIPKGIHDHGFSYHEALLWPRLVLDSKQQDTTQWNVNTHEDMGTSTHGDGYLHESHAEHARIIPDGIGSSWIHAMEYSHGIRSRLGCILVITRDGVSRPGVIYTNGQYPILDLFDCPSVLMDHQMGYLG